MCFLTASFSAAFAQSSSEPNKSSSPSLALFLPDPFLILSLRLAFGLLSAFSFQDLSIKAYQYNACYMIDPSCAPFSHCKNMSSAVVIMDLFVTLFYSSLCQFLSLLHQYSFPCILFSENLGLYFFFNSSSPVVTIRTTRFNIHKFSVLHTQCVYVFSLNIRTNSDYFTTCH